LSGISFSLYPDVLSSADYTTLQNDNIQLNLNQIKNFKNSASGGRKK
jgi:hypothetical protein